MLVQLKAAFQQAGKTSERSLPKLEANILVIGAETSLPWSRILAPLTVQFLTQRFIGEYGNIESIYSHSVKMAGQKACFSIWDSACRQMASLQSYLNEKQLHWPDGFIIVYSICDHASFSFARHQFHWIQHSKRRIGAGRTPIILLGNKRDLQHQRAVSSEEGRLLALSTDSGFFEISTAETYLLSGLP